MKNVLVTGSCRSIGLKIAEMYAKNGFNVFVTGRNPEKAAKIANSIGAKGFFACDFNDDDACEKLFEAAVKTLGNIDILVNNAGVYECSEIEKARQLDEIINVNFKTPYKLAALCIPEMKKRKFGRIINIGSVSGAIGEAYAVSYSMTKSSYSGFSKALGLEVAQFGITVNTINPGWVETDMTAEDACSADEIVDVVPQKRFVTPEEIAHACLYLTSDHARGITGQSINVCAGISMG